MEVHRGEVFYADLSPVVGSEQRGVRPVLIVQNEIGNKHIKLCCSFLSRVGSRITYHSLTRSGEHVSDSESGKIISAVLCGEECRSFRLCHKCRI